MPKVIPLLLAILLAVGAVCLHLPDLAPHSTAFTRGSFAVLGLAEREIKADKQREALGNLCAAYIRAMYEGRPGIAQRIRGRIYNVGLELLNRNAEDAWPFFEAFVLWSDDFNRDALGIESMCLSMPGMHKTRFEYHLMRPDGLTFWARQPDQDWTALWPLWVGWQEATQKPLITGIFLEKGATWPQGSYAIEIPIDLLNQTPMPIKAYITAAGAPDNAQVLYSPPSPFGKANYETGGRWIIDDLLAKRNTRLSRVILFTNRLMDPRRVSITLVRSYMPL